MKHLERSYSTLCCSISDIWSFLTPPHPPAFTGNCSNAHHYACDGVCVLNEARKCNKGLTEAFWKKSFNFMLLSSGYFVLSHPTPLRLQEVLAMHSVTLAIRSVSQMKFASAIRVWLKHFERSYSTLCCWVPDILYFLAPPPCVYKKL